MKNKIYGIFTALFLTLASFGTVFAADSSKISQNNDIAVINIEKISKESQVVKYIAKKISKQRDRYQKEISAKEKKLQKEKDRIEAKKNILSQEKLAKEQKKFFGKVEGLKKFAKKRDKSLKSAYSTAIKKVNDEVGKIVSQVAQERSISLVLPSSQVVYSLDSLDITAEVIKRLNKKMKKIKVRFK